MLKLKIDSAQFNKEMSNVMQYSLGFFEGVKVGVPTFLKNAGDSTLDSLKQYIDSNARVAPHLLHHVYEWYQTGSPEARLFDITYSISSSNISFASSFSQSRSVKKGSNAPFYNKAEIMESGTQVTITPKKKVLVFEDNGEQVFTSKPVVVSNPGGNVAGEYAKVFDSFFKNYFAQSYLESAGILQYLNSPSDFKKNMSVSSGRSKGISVGKNWISKAGTI